MKKIIVLIFILSSATIYSQDLFNSYEYGEIFFRNGKNLRGNIKISSHNKIKYKLLLGDKKQVFGYKTVKKIIFDKDNIEFHFKFENKKIVLVKRIIKGKLDLFETEGATGSMPMGSAGGIGFGVSRSYKIYHIGKANSDLIERLPNNPKKKKFKRIIIKFTSDCQNFLELIKDNKSVIENFEYKDTRVEDMVNYYNSHCN